MEGNAMYYDRSHSTREPVERPVLAMHRRVFDEMMRSIGSIAAESGGAFGGAKDTGEISHYHFDKSSRRSAATYSPDHEFLNRLFDNDWNPKGIRLRGFVHSHPGGSRRPSYGDEIYAARILDAIDDLDCLWLPIINTVPDTGEFRLTPWVARRARKGVDIVRGRVKVLRDCRDDGCSDSRLTRVASISDGFPHDEIVIPGTHLVSVTGSMTEVVADQPIAVSSDTIGAERGEARSIIGETFDRVRAAYDLELMAKTRIIAVGAGGAAEWLESMARAGTGQFVLIDPDVVSETNLATQQTYRKDIGRPKVECIAERIRDINPGAIVVLEQKLLDEFDDDAMHRLVTEPIEGAEPGCVILCGLTDNFLAQARINRLALKFGIPSLCGQVYREGRGAEITFTYPGVTPACHRCALSSRYRHYLEAGGRNDVTSDGTPIFATARLNSIKGFVALAMIHHGSQHPRWGRILARIGKRNLIMIRLDPDFTSTMKIATFDNVFAHADQNRLFFDEVVWLPQDPENPETDCPISCPDCHGTGDLRQRVGTIADTRLMIQAAASSETPEPCFPVDTQRALMAYRQNGGLQ
ncbi:MAG: ThiF family adenylyltransferase [bacterium]|nr:ThiF family adenylyltransferase [bacterium]